MVEPLVFEIVSPEKLVLSKTVIMVTVPGGEGDYGVLAGHAPMITTVKPGVIDVYTADDKTVSDRIFVAGGFAEVTSTRCTVLAEDVMPVSELNLAKLQEEEKALAEQIAGAGEADTNALRDKHAIVTAKIEAIAA